MTVTAIASIQMTPDAWKEYCILKRRMEWLETSHAYGYRKSPTLLDELKTRYSDVSVDREEFSRLLVRGN
jgi:hypothetical protein